MLSIGGLATGDEVLITSKTTQVTTHALRSTPQDGVMEVLRVSAQMGRAVNNDDHDIEVAVEGQRITRPRMSGGRCFSMVNQIQSMEAAQGISPRARAHHGGPLPDTGIPASSSGQATARAPRRGYCEAKEIRIHAAGI